MGRVLWTQKKNIGPKARSGHAMAYDEERARVMLFGGSAGTLFLSDTWGWDGEDWTQLQDIGPSARAFHGLAHDQRRQRTVLFGGRTGPDVDGETWEWSAEEWTQVAHTGPAPRAGHAMAYDYMREHVLLFGGQTAQGLMNDTWSWDGNEWVQLADSGPSPRQYAAIAYDPNRERVVLFGGANSAASFNDTWEWNGETWTEAADFGPQGTAAAAMVFKGYRCALFGGMPSAAAPGIAAEVFGRSWEWDGRHWTARQDMGPGPRVFHAMAFDRRRARVVLFGGSALTAAGAASDTDVRGDTWEQFEPGTVALDSLEMDPNPVEFSSPMPPRFTVGLAAPATNNVSVTLRVAGQLIGVIEIGAGSVSGSIEAGFPPDVTLGTAILTAEAGSSRIAISITLLEPVIQASLIAIEASPNPVTAGQPLTLRVEFDRPVLQDVSVELIADGNPISSVTAVTGTSEATATFPIDSATPVGDHIISARAGNREVTTTISIVGAT